MDNKDFGIHKCGFCGREHLSIWDLRYKGEGVNFCSKKCIIFDLIKDGMIETDVEISKEGCDG